MPLHPYTRYRLRSISTLVVAVGIAGLLFQIAHDQTVSAWGFSLGAALGLLLGLLEHSRLAARIGTLPFLAASLAKAGAYIGIAAAVFLTAGFLAGLFAGKTLDEFGAYALSPEAVVQVGFAFVVFLVVVSVRQVNRLLGPGILARYLSGRYHRPRKAQRIFLFLDLTSSTAIAERLGPENYSAFLQRFYAELDRPIIDSEGELFQYVGDEIVMVWTPEKGAEHMNCIRFFFLVERRIAELKEVFLGRFGVIPEIKAGLHYGEVLIAEIGSYRKDIAYHGDPINTAARICATCNQVGARFLCSADMFTLFSPHHEEFRFTSMGMFNLKGKKKPVGLLSIEQRHQARSSNHC